MLSWRRIRITSSKQSYFIQGRRMENLLLFIFKFILQIVLLIVVSGIASITSLFITELILDIKNRKGRNMPDRSIR